MDLIYLLFPLPGTIFSKDDIESINNEIGVNTSSTLAAINSSSPLIINKDILIIS